MYSYVKLNFEVGLLFAYFDLWSSSAVFWHFIFTLLYKGKKGPKMKMASNKKNAKKQTHFQIQFFMKIHVTSFDFGHFLL